MLIFQQEPEAEEPKMHSVLSQRGVISSTYRPESVNAHGGDGIGDKLVGVIGPSFYFGKDQSERKKS